MCNAVHPYFKIYLPSISCKLTLIFSLFNNISTVLLELFDPENLQAAINAVHPYIKIKIKFIYLPFLVN
jgi:hypothetical protein